MTSTQQQNETIKAAYNALQDFFKLCILLFGHKDDDSEKAKKINELIGKDNEFYKEAVALAEDCEMSWDNLTPEDSDELQLIMLDDFFNRIKSDEEFSYTLNISIKPKEKKSDDKGE